MPTLASMAEAVGALLQARGETIAVSESSTGGLIAAALLAVPGASAYFIGGGVLYTHQAREALLQVRLTDHPGMRASTRTCLGPPDHERRPSARWWPPPIRSPAPIAYRTGFGGTAAPAE